MVKGRRTFTYGLLVLVVEIIGFVGCGRPRKFCEISKFGMPKHFVHQKLKFEIIFVRNFNNYHQQNF